MQVATSSSGRAVKQTDGEDFCLRLTVFLLFMTSFFNFKKSFSLHVPFHVYFAVGCTLRQTTFIPGYGTNDNQITRRHIQLYEQHV